MEKKKTSIIEEVEDDLACAAFAEEGEPCPIDAQVIPATEKTEKPAGDDVATTMACAAFAEEGEACPIGAEEKNK